MIPTKCSVCGGELEDVGGGALMCKGCRMGFRDNGKPLPNMEQILEDGVKKMKMLKMLYLAFHGKEPTNEILTNLYSFHEHRVVGHPETKDGYCEFCERNWAKLSESEFFEQLGYKKSRWFNEDGTTKAVKTFEENKEEMLR